MLRRTTLGPWLLIAAIALIGPSAAAQDGDAILGLWATEPDPEDGNAHVEVWLEDDRYFGKIVWLEKPVYNPGDPMSGQSKVDRENPDRELQDRPVIGLMVLEDFRWDGRGAWEKGRIYDPDNGKTYRCVARLDDDGRTLKVRGYVGFSLFGRTTEWTRVQP
jgi:uncharacterized protein (DUF2147 family)